MYRVVWLQTALNELADLWTKADSEQRRSITAAVRSVDRQLEVDPEQQGESRSNDLRVFFQPPLGIVYQVDESQHLVRVLRAWILRSRR
jgi:hypothetical protein